MSDDSNIRGRGSSILLPPDGNPFKRAEGQPADPAARFGPPAEAPAGGPEADTPADLSPEDVAAMFPASADDRNTLPETAAARALGRGAIDDSPLLTAEALAALNPQPGPSFPHSPPRQPAPADSLAAFDPDAVIDDRPGSMSRMDSAAAPVDVSAFNPDLPAGEPALTFPFGDSFAPDASSIKADAPLPESPFPAVEAFAPPPAGAPLLAPASTASGAGLGEKPRPRPAPTVAAPESDIVPDDVSSPTSNPSKDLPIVPADSVTLPLKEKESLLKALVTPQRVEELWKRIDEAERRAIQEDSSLPPQRTANLENLRAARNILLGGEEYYEDALRYVAEVEADLLYTRRVRKWSYTFGLGVLIYNVLWVLALSYSYNITDLIATRFAGAVDPQFGSAIWITLLAGGLGGVSKSMFSLYTHVTKQDFDRQYLMWYIASPIAGTVLGLFVYVFAQMGLASVIAAAQMGVPTLTGQAEAAVVNTGGFILYGLAWVVGFQQNLILRMVDRVIKFVFGSSDERKEAEGEAKPRPPVKKP